MNSIITRVIANPHSKTSVICYPSGIKPFVISKSKAKALKPNRTYIVDLKVNSTTGYVYAAIVRSELALKKGK
jgi:hypothetical protein